MNTSDLSANMKALLSIRAVLARGGANESSFYTGASRGSALSPDTRQKVAAGLRETADELRALAKRIDV